MKTLKNNNHESEEMHKAMQWIGKLPSPYDGIVYNNIVACNPDVLNRKFDSLASLINSCEWNDAYGWDFWRQLHSYSVSPGLPFIPTLDPQKCIGLLPKEHHDKAFSDLKTTMRFNDVNEFMEHLKESDFEYWDDVHAKIIL